MKINTADYVWAFVSLLIVGVSFHYGKLVWGILIIYVLMALLFAYHIYIVKRRMRNSVAVYGVITGYHTAENGRLVYPVVSYETETGREISSVYTISDREMRYEEGSEEMICYDPDDPMFFYFANREEELTRDYYRYIIIGAAAAALLMLAVKLIFY